MTCTTTAPASPEPTRNRLTSRLAVPNHTPQYVSFGPPSAAQIVAEARARIEARAFELDVKFVLS